MGHLSTSERVDASKVIENGCTKSTNTNGECSNGKINGYCNGKTIINNSINSDELIKSTNNNNNKDINNINNNDIIENREKETNEFTSAQRNKTDLNVYTTEFKGDSFLGFKFNARLKWDKIIPITALHLFFIYGFATYDNSTLKFNTAFWAYITGILAGIGVTGGAHRLWTHKSYKANIVLRTILMLCFSSAGQNTMFDWVRDHRVHHKYSETDADPHNSNRGFFFAHVGWLMLHKHPEVIRRGRQMDMSDVLNDPVIQFHQKYFIPLKFLLCFILPTMVPVYFWDESWYNAMITQCIIRYVFSLNFTWSVNSAAHMWGYRPFDRRINPSENHFVSFIAMGEGWHNYHHVFPWDYKAAELGRYGLNLTTMWIDFFSKIGWAWDLKEPSKDLIRKTIEKNGDGTHPVYGHHHHHPEEVPIPDDEFDENSNLIVQKKVK